jgi:crotonobetainyl-CoA:carnitine CoA-transferase CaiB-like acyl-CoA transferase
VSEDGRPLDGLHVRERTRGLAATVGGSLLAGLGARVARDEASAFPILDRRKHVERSATPDVVLADEPGDADDAPIACRVSAWGRTGPRCDLPPDEALVQAATA